MNAHRPPVRDGGEGPTHEARNDVIGEDRLRNILTSGLVAFVVTMRERAWSVSPWAGHRASSTAETRTTNHTPRRRDPQAHRPPRPHVPITGRG
ncbi:hypothetical protein DSY14_26505 [Nocardiopsis sp. MG754419]|nr:hypothetical protein [Nocardiopsis sp. MG754419]